MPGWCPADVSGNTQGTCRGPSGAGWPSPAAGRAGSAWTRRHRRTSRSSGAARAEDRTTRAPRSRRSRDPPSNPPASRPDRRPAVAQRSPSRHCNEYRASVLAGGCPRQLRSRPSTAHCDSARRNRCLAPYAAPLPDKCRSLGTPDETRREHCVAPRVPPVFPAGGTPAARSSYWGALRTVLRQLRAEGARNGRVRRSRRRRGGAVR